MPLINGYKQPTLNHTFSVYEVVSKKRDIIYYGVTDDPEARFKAHKTDKGSSLYPFLNTYPENDFKFNVLQTFDNPFSMLEREKLYISIDNKKHIINRTAGGEWSFNSRKVRDYIFDEIIMITSFNKIFNKNLRNITSSFSPIFSACDLIASDESNAYSKRLKENLAHKLDEVLFFYHKGQRFINTVKDVPVNRATYEEVTTIRIGLRATIIMLTDWANTELYGTSYG